MRCVSFEGTVAGTLITGKYTIDNPDDVGSWTAVLMPVAE